MAQVIADVDRYPARLGRLTLIWVLVALVLFPVLAILGLVMRVVQAGYFAALPPEWFYAVMTLHGLGMVGLWFVAGIAASACSSRNTSARRSASRGLRSA